MYWCTVHTYGSICDGARENRLHIKSIDWYASTWSSGDIVEVNFNKDKKLFHAAEIIDSNPERTIYINFIVIILKELQLIMLLFVHQCH